MKRNNNITVKRIKCVTCRSKSGRVLYLDRGEGFEGFQITTTEVGEKDYCCKVPYLTTNSLEKEISIWKSTINRLPSERRFGLACSSVHLEYDERG